MGDGEPTPPPGRRGREGARLRRPVRRRPSGSTWGAGVSACLRAGGGGGGHLQCGCVLLLVWGWGCERHRYPPATPGASGKGIASMDWTKDPIFHQFLPQKR